MFRSGLAPASRLAPPQVQAWIKPFKTVLATSLLLTLVACGGGGGSGGNFDGGGAPSTGGGGTSPPPPPPTPIYGIGNGTGTTYQDGVIDASQTSLNSGETATLRANIVVTNRSNESPPAEGSGLTVGFTSTCAANGRASFGTPQFVSVGLVSVSYTNNGCDGQDTVTATLSNNDTATVRMTMVGPQVLTVNFVSSTHDQLALAGIGGNESTELTFKVAGPQGVPIIGKQVSFSVNTTVGGASILPGRETGITDQDGLVRTVLSSGTVAVPVSVRAVHQESGKQGSSSDIIISTGVAVSDRFSISYQPWNPVAAATTDGVTVALNIIASDVFGNNPTDGTRVSFVAPESGNIQSSCELVNGACTVNWRSTSPRPDDMRVEVIAYTDGAENFVDRNGNSLYDAGDGAITDLGEPYADENEDNTYNLGEFFVDTNRNGVRDVGNGLWDGPCLEKVNTAAVCTGDDTVAVFRTVTIAMPFDTVRISNYGTFPSSGGLTIPAGSSLSLGGLFLADANMSPSVLAKGGNPPPFGTTITFTVSGDGVGLQGLTSTTVPNTLEPYGPLGTTVVVDPVDDEIPTNTFLLLTVTVPNRQTQQFSWPITVTLP